MNSIRCPSCASRHLSTKPSAFFLSPSLLSFLLPRPRPLSYSTRFHWVLPPSCPSWPFYYFFKTQGLLYSRKIVQMFYCLRYCYQQKKKKVACRVTFLVLHLFLSFYFAGCLQAMKELLNYYINKSSTLFYCSLSLPLFLSLFCLLSHPNRALFSSLCLSLLIFSFLLSSSTSSSLLSNRPFTPLSILYSFYSF